MGANWVDIRNEYINSSISYHDLAKKRNVPYPTLRDRGKKESWGAKRAEQRELVSKLTLQIATEKIVAAEVDRMARLLGLGDKVSQKLEKAIGQIETCLVNGEKTETGLVDTYKLRQIVSSIKDLKEVFSNDISTGNQGQLETLIKGLQYGE